MHHVKYLLFTSNIETGELRISSNVVEKMRDEFAFCFAAAIHINEEQIWGNMYEFCSTELESAQVFTELKEIKRLTQPPLTCRVRFDFDFLSKRLLRYKSWGVHLVMPQDEDIEDNKSVYGGIGRSRYLLIKVW